ESQVPDQTAYIESFEQAAPMVPGSSSSLGSGTIDPEQLDKDAPAPKVGKEMLPDNALRSAREVSDETQDLRITQQAVELVDQGDIEQALILLTEFIDQVPGAHRSRETLATILLAQGDQLAAKRLLDVGLSKAPNFSGFKKLMARLQMTTEPERALDLLAQVPPRPVDDFEYHELYALLLLKTGRFDESVARYRALLQLDSDNPKLWLAFAIALNATGAIDEALSAHQMASRFGLSDPALDQYNRTRLKSLRGAG
ncbi:MAG: tetratricopeptide repeat protein, partial [Pseudomonadales bacterium]|nr:tetratricopeptide repeat protein [Pseudomonadales bacterium]